MSAAFVILECLPLANIVPANYARSKLRTMRPKQRSQCLGGLNILRRWSRFAVVHWMVVILQNFVTSKLVNVFFPFTWVVGRCAAIWRPNRSSHANRNAPLNKCGYEYFSFFPIHADLQSFFKLVQPSAGQVVCLFEVFTFFSFAIPFEH